MLNEIFLKKKVAVVSRRRGKSAVNDIPDPDVLSSQRHSSHSRKNIRIECWRSASSVVISGGVVRGKEQIAPEYKNDLCRFG